MYKITGGSVVERVPKKLKMVSPADGDSGGLSIGVEGDDDPVTGDGASRRSCDVAKWEKRLNGFVRMVAFCEWAGDALGTLAFLWATVVLLGGFCTMLKVEDFWYATAIIFVENFRVLSRNYKLSDRSLFGTMKAIKWIRSSFSLLPPQEQNEGLAIMGVYIHFVRSVILRSPFGKLASIGMAALVIFICKLQSSRVPPVMRWPRRYRQLVLWAFLTGLILIAVRRIYIANNNHIKTEGEAKMGNSSAVHHEEDIALCVFHLAVLAPVAVSVLLLSLRPPRIANLTNRTLGRKLLTWAKVILTMCLVGDLVLALVGDLVRVFSDDLVLMSSFSNTTMYLGFLDLPFTTMVLSLGSLQTPSNTPSGPWIDTTLNICFIGELLSPFLGNRSKIPSAAILVLLLIGNMQIPMAMTRVVLSSLRLFHIAHDNVYPQKHVGDKMNLGPSVVVFHVLVLFQGTLHILACIVDPFSFFLRRSLARLSGFRGQWGVRAVNLYYQHVYATCMETGVLASGSIISLGSFAIESLCSNSREMQLAGLHVLDSLLQQPDSNQDLISKIVSSKNVVCTLIDMLGWTVIQDREIRFLAARIIAELAGNLTNYRFPCMVSMVSSLLDTENLTAHESDNSGWNNSNGNFSWLSCATQVAGDNGMGDSNRNEPRAQELLSVTPGFNEENAMDIQPLGQESLVQQVFDDPCNQQMHDQLAHREGSNKDGSWVWQCWWRMKESWSIEDEPPLKYHHFFPIHGIVILEKLAYNNLENCAEISSDIDLVSKIVGFIGYTTDTTSRDYVPHKSLIHSSLNLVRRLATISGKSGSTLRQELWECPILLSNLTGILNDNNRHQLWEPAVNIIANLALGVEARQEIGSTQVIMEKLMHAFLGKDGVTNMYYDQKLRIAAGEALLNLATGSTANCLAMLDEHGCELIKALKDMLFYDDFYMYVAASLLRNICAHSRDKLYHLGLSEHLSAVLPMLMEKIMVVEGKQLEALIGFVAECCNIIPGCIAYSLESRIGAASFVQKLVCALRANKKPSPEFPRMRRVIVQMAISILELCPHYATIFREQRMMEALSDVEKSPSKVEKYMVFVGNVGVGLESGLPLPVLVARAKGLID